MTDDTTVGPLETAAEEAAAHHRLTGFDSSPATLPVWSGLSALRSWLDRALAAAAGAGAEGASAAEWLLDNGYHVQRARYQIAEDLPRGFYARLPALRSGEKQGIPRIFDLAHTLLRASHLQLSLEGAVGFLRAYQRHLPLSTAELWAFPTMLRLSCLEILVGGYGRQFPEIRPPFALSVCARELEFVDDTERVSRALMNLAVISTIPWKDFFDRTSIVEAMLRRDPAGIYARMDFDTRDRYRRVIERLAQVGGRAEAEVAGDLLALCRARDEEGLGAHVGYWLVDEGLAAFERQHRLGPAALARIGRWLSRHGATLYAVALCAAGVVGFALPALILAELNATSLQWVLGLALSVLPASILSVTLVNWLASRLVSPRVLPKLDFESGIDPDCATAVVVPVLIADAAEIPGLMARLESHHLSNPDPALQFALLSDPADAATAERPEDRGIEQALIDGIANLNARYRGPDGEGPFRLLHRRRSYNPDEGCWMAWERKRGKLEQFNRFVLDGDFGPFGLTAGPVERLRQVRFVVTADADTRLPPGVVNRMVGAFAHPLNHARFDADGIRVTGGYTILQPRVELAPQPGGETWFMRIFGGDTAIDIYSRAVSHVYQDLFGSGIFVGKGIYDVASFERSLEGRIPENAILSHDLLEGLYGRAALASDIIVYENFPAGYGEFARRWHRWMRGDWQLLPWLLPVVPGRGGRRLRNRLSVLDRLKIFDNLRRSLLPASILLLLLGGWFMLPGSPWIWTMLALLAPGAYLLTDLVTGLARGRRRGVLQSSLRRLGDHAARWGLAICFLVSNAAVSASAISVTFWRLAFGRKLLEWTSAAHVSARFAAHHPRYAAWREMWPSPVFSLLIGSAVAAVRPEAMPAAAPLLLLWLAAPEIAVALGRRAAAKEAGLLPEDRTFLRLAARRIWLFFERFAGPEDHWLPPDNFQEEPQEAIAHRTSPTNVGMLMLSSLTAWKLGHIPVNELMTRLSDTLDTLDRLEGFRGHIFNWYDTRTLHPLAPRYVSTVDSGNLAVSLVVVAQACRDIVRRPPFSSNLWGGLDDVLALLEEALAAGEFAPEDPAFAELHSIRTAAASAGADSDQWHATLERLCGRDYPALASHVAASLEKREALPPERRREIQIWLERVRHHLQAMRRDLRTFLPWLDLLEQPPPECADEAARLAAILKPDLSIDAMPDACRAACSIFQQQELYSTPESENWKDRLDRSLRLAVDNCRELRARIEPVASRASKWAHGMDFAILFDRSSRLFHIGYDATADRLDPHHYDLLASEARLASFFAIAKGDVPSDHWFHLGRPVTKRAAGLSLVSWNGSMFEYLMPGLFLRSQPSTLLGQSNGSAVDVQRAYARGHRLPWGISESGFAALGADLSYRYHAFGVPELGLRRGLSEDYVVAPYASALALSVRPRHAADNLKRLADHGMIGTYGFYEAADFTQARVPAGDRFTTVRSYMAHHHGMALAAIGNALCDDVFVSWFHDDRHVRTVDLLLNERVPWELPAELGQVELPELPVESDTAIPQPQPWAPVQLDGAVPLQAIGNGRLASHVAAHGGGCLMWEGHALTRPDWAEQRLGLWVYARDRDSRAIWSATPEPVRPRAQEARVLFSAERVEFQRREHGIALSMTVGFAFHDDLEIRRVTVVNEEDRPRRIDLTSYGEVMLAPPLDGLRHPAFSKLFVHSEFLPDLNGLLFERAPRSPQEKSPVLLHLLLADDSSVRLRGFETDRAGFLGRHGEPGDPAALHAPKLAGTAGWTLDPVLSLQAGVELEPHGRTELAFLTLASGSRLTALETAERYRTLAALDWAVEEASSQTARELHGIGLTPERLVDAQLLLTNMQASAADPAGEHRTSTVKIGREALWAHGVSGDHPVLLLRLTDGSHSDLLRTLVRIQEMFRRRGVSVDLVCLYTGGASYIEPVRDRVTETLEKAGILGRLGQDGGIHLAGIDRTRPEHVAAIENAARVKFDEHAGSLREQLRRSGQRAIPRPRFEGVAETSTEPRLPQPALAPRPLLFENHFGGFAADGAYVIRLGAGETTPAPWSNVLANDAFGSIVTEAGLGFTWSVNSGENRLSPWHNDPVRDLQGEALFIRDEESARFWTPTPLPAGREAGFEIRHEPGRSEWTSNAHGLEQQLSVAVAPDDPVKLVRLLIRNPGARTRRVTLTYYIEWLLGPLGFAGAPFRRAGYDASAHMLWAHNSWDADFGNRVAFLTSSIAPHSLTVSRRDFLGPDHDLRQPDGLARWDLGGQLQSTGDDCCGAFQVHLDIAPGTTEEAVFAVGQGASDEEASALAKKWQDPVRAERAFATLSQDWNERLSAVEVKTPDPAFDMLVNRWLPYQTISSRVWARAGFYQAGGAFGFRDQLQDVLALLHTDPHFARDQILAAAAHQFEEGDVLHWWHPPSGRGVRTRCSDDLLWLVHATAVYVEATGDEAILDAEIPFLHAPPLADDEEDRFARFEETERGWPLFDHCERALGHGYRLGAHSLPLIGTGDWNDGMDRVGAQGRGESIWLAWFLIAAIDGFVGLAERRQRTDVAEHWRKRAAGLARAVEAAGWDGRWYLRAFDDDGRPWGTADDVECRIDSISQSWAVISGAADPVRARMALRAAKHHLMRKDDRLVRLLWPAFDEGPRDPGYIKAYPPGIRENGGQYTHAAAWLGIAFALAGDGDSALEVFNRINPIKHADAFDKAAQFRTEPYAVPADVGGEPPHVGRGGWSWYTGAAGWSWRLAVEHILGIKLVDGDVRIDPCLPSDWPEARVTLRTARGALEIVIDMSGDGDGAASVLRVDGEVRTGDRIEFPGKGRTRQVSVTMPARQPVAGRQPAAGARG